MLDEQPSSARDQSIVEMATKLERLRAAMGNLETAMSRLCDDQTELAAKVDLILEGRCRDLEARAIALEEQAKQVGVGPSCAIDDIRETIDKLVRSQVGYGNELARLRSLQDEVRRLADPIRQVSDTMYDLNNRLGQRVESLELRNKNRFTSARVLIFVVAFIVIAGSMNFVGLR